MKPRSKPEFPEKTYQLKIELEGISPPIWRRLLVPSNTSLGRLHTIIQAVRRFLGTSDQGGEDFNAGGFK